MLQYLTKDPNAGLPNDWRTPGDPTQSPLPGGVASLTYMTAIAFSIPPGGGGIDFFFGGGAIQGVWLDPRGPRGRVTAQFVILNPGAVAVDAQVRILFNGLAPLNGLAAPVELLIPSIPPGGKHVYDLNVEFIYNEVDTWVITRMILTDVTNTIIVVPDAFNGPYTVATAPGDTAIALNIDANNECIIQVSAFLAQFTAGQPLTTSV